MVCNNCGTNCDPNRSFCPVCRAPLPIEDRDLPVQQSQETLRAPGYPAGGQITPPAAQATSSAAQPAGLSSDASWGFVQPPSWPKPNFDINAVDTLPLPDLEAASPAAQDAPPIQQSNTYAESTPYAAGASAPPAAAAGAYRPPFRGGAFPQGAPASTRYIPTAAAPEPSAGQPILSVGEYDATSAYQTGSFGRMPARKEYDQEDDFGPPLSKRGGSSRGRSSSGRHGGQRRSRGGGGLLRGGLNKNVLFFGAAGLLVVLLVVFSVIILNRNYGGVGGFFRTVFGGSVLLKPVETSEGISEGMEVWQVTVHARQGNTVTMRVGGRETSDSIGKNNLKQLLIPKVMLMPDEPWEGETAQLAPEVFITTKNGEEIPVEVPPFTVTVPKLNLSVTTPESSSITVSRNKVAFAGKVDDGNVAVTIQGQPATVAADGSFTGEYDLPGVGTHSLTVEAKKNGYQIARAVFQVEYTQQTAYVNVDKGSLRAADNSTSVTVKGEIDAGATMTVSCSSSNVTLGTPTVESTGAFSFTAEMSEIGSYTVDVVITTSAGATSNGTIIIERPPVLQTYSAGAYKLDYKRMVDEPSHGGSYRCVGTVIEVIQTDPFVIAKLQTTDGVLVFEYHNISAKVEVGDGKTYNVFGDLKGKDEETGLPLVYGWFIIKE